MKISRFYQTFWEAWMGRIRGPPVAGSVCDDFHQTNSASQPARPRVIKVLDHGYFPPHTFKT